MEEAAAAAGRLRATVRNKTVPQPFRRAVWAGLRRRTAAAFLFPRVRSGGAGAGGCPVTARREEGDGRGGKMAKGAAPRARSGFPALTRRSPAPCCRAAEGHGGSRFPLGAGSVCMRAPGPACLRRERDAAVSRERRSFCLRAEHRRCQRPAGMEARRGGGGVTAGFTFVGWD